MKGSQVDTTKTQREMLEFLHERTSDIVAGLVREDLAEMKELPDSDGSPSFSVLQSPGALDRQHGSVVVSGIPEETGIWSYPLLERGRFADASMKPYFKLARALNWGIVASIPTVEGKKETGASTIASSNPCCRFSGDQTRQERWCSSASRPAGRWPLNSLTNIPKSLQGSAAWF